MPPVRKNNKPIDAHISPFVKLGYVKINPIFSKKKANFVLQTHNNATFALKLPIFNT